MSFNKLSETNDLLIMVTNICLLALINFTAARWILVLIALLAAAALVLNIIIWKRRKAHVTSRAPRGLRHWKLGLNTLICVACLVSVVFKWTG